MNSSLNDNNSPNNSDTDDWTLLSPPHSESSTSSSPEQDVLISQTSSSASSSLEHINNDVEDYDDDNIRENGIRLDDDGLTEIDLTCNTDHVQYRYNNTLAIIDENDDIQIENEHLQTRTSSSEPSMSGFQAMDTTDNESVGSGSSYQAHINNTSGRRFSLTDSELSEYVDLGKQRNELLTKVLEDNNVSNESSDKQNLLVVETSIDNRLNVQTRPSDKLKSTRPKLKEQQAKEVRCDLNVFETVFVILMGTVIISLLITCMTLPILDVVDKYDDFNPLDMETYVITSKQQLQVELLYRELCQCIERQNPASFGYYIHERRKYYDNYQRIYYLNDNKKHNMQLPGPSLFDNDASFKYNKKALVCYGQESKWRKRFQDLKVHHKFDLQNLIKEVKRNITIDMLEQYRLPFELKLILNQIEYVEYMEKKREKKQAEETIKYLRAENSKLLRLVNKPEETDRQKLFVELEMQNSNLIRENKALKASLMQKAGTSYIRQSYKIDGLEKENILLKNFHNQVAQDVSKSLKQFNLYTIDPTTNLDDIDSLNSQLILTKNHLIRLTDRVSKVLIENESLKEELKENHLLTTSLANRVNIEEFNAQLIHDDGSNNNSNALIANSCMRNLASLKEKTNQLEQEVIKLRNNCNKSSCNVELEQSFGHYLNKTDKNDHEKSINWERLGLTQYQQQTAVDKHNKDAFSLKTDDIVDDLMVFLTKFNNQIESNGLAVVNHLGSGEAGYLTGFQKLMNNEIKVLPNYLREIYVQQKKKNSLINENYDISKIISDVPIRMILPPTPPTINDFPRSRSNFTKTSIKVDNLPTLEPIKAQECTQSNDVLNENLITNTTAQTIKDSWFFRRAKQRKQLRQNKQDLQTAWIYKRAKLREKLRKASSYIDDTYVNQCIRRKFDKLPRPTILNNNNSKRNYQSHNSKQQQQNKNKYRQERINNNHHNYDQRHHNYRHKNYYNNYQHVYNHEEL